MQRPPDSGHIELGGYVSRLGWGAKLDTEARIGHNTALFGRGYISNDYTRTDYGALAGLRITF